MKRKTALAATLMLGITTACVLRTRAPAADDASAPETPWAHLFDGMTVRQAVDETFELSRAFAHAERVRQTRAVEPYAAPRPAGVITTYNVLDYGAKCDGSTDDRAAVVATLTAACAVPGSIVYTAPSANGCIVGKNPAQAYSILLPCGDITLQGIRGKSFWKHPTGLPATSTVLLQIQQQDLVTIDGMGFDGNWGNAATTIAEASNNLALSGTYTLNVVSTAGFPASGAINVTSTTGNHVVTCAGKTPTTFTSCTGGSGVVMRDYAVGYVDGVSGINQGTQAVPSNFLVFSRGTTNLTIKNSVFRDAYGDGVWMGNSVANHEAWTTNAKILNNTFYMMARIGVTFGSPVINALVEGNTITYAHQECIDAEPQDFPDRNVTIRSNVLTGWWDPTQTAIAIINIRQGAGGGQLWGSTQSNWRVEHNTIFGPVEMNGVWNVDFTDNSVISDIPASNAFSPPTQFGPLQIQFGGGDINVTGNYFFARAQGDGVDGDCNNAAVCVATNAGGSDGSGNNTYASPVRVRVSNNTVDAENGRDGILLLAPGGAINNATGTSTAVGLTTLVDTSATWVKNIFTDQIVIVGGAQAVVHSNTACPGDTCTLTLTLVNNSTTTAWQTVTGEYAPTPTVGAAYTIYRPVGDVDISDNQISLKNSAGYGSGRYGIYMTDANGGTPTGRVRIHDNVIKDANTDGIHVHWALFQTFPLVDIYRNYGYDDQATPTMTTLVGFDNTALIKQLVIADNIAGESGTSGNLIAEVSGLTAGTWLTHDGNPADWAGYGSPNSVVTAPIGSTYRQVDGTTTIVWTQTDRHG